MLRTTSPRSQSQIVATMSVGSNRSTPNAGGRQQATVGAEADVLDVLSGLLGDSAELGTGVVDDDHFASSVTGDDHGQQITVGAPLQTRTPTPRPRPTGR